MTALDAAIRSVEARQQAERRDVAIAAYVRNELFRGWLVVEAQIRFPFADDEFRREYVDLNAPPVSLT